MFQTQALTRESPDLFAIEDPLALAVEARWNGDNALAYRHFYAAWLATPNNDDVATGFINIALRTGHAKEAYIAASKLSIDPDLIKPALLAAQVLAEISAGKSDDPELRLNKALEYSPSDFRLWNALGRFHDKAGNTIRAQEYYLQALATGGSKSGVINNLGMSLLMQGERKSALDKFEQAIAIEPENPLFDNNRRLSLALNEDYSAATEGLSDARAADILNDAGYIAKSRNDNSEAATLFQAAIARSSVHHARAHANLQSLKRVNE